MAGRACKTMIRNPLTILLLRIRGHRIVAQDYATPVGNIPFVTEKGNRLAFIETKRRHKAIIPARHRRRIIRAAQYWLAAHPNFSERETGFDVVFGNVWPRYVPNVFSLPR